MDSNIVTTSQTSYFNLIQGILRLTEKMQIFLIRMH